MLQAVSPLSILLFGSFWQRGRGSGNEMLLLCFKHTGTFCCAADYSWGSNQVVAGWLSMFMEKQDMGLQWMRYVSDLIIKLQMPISFHTCGFGDVHMGKSAATLWTEGSYSVTGV